MVSIVTSNVKPNFVFNPANFHQQILALDPTLQIVNNENVVFSKAVISITSNYIQWQEYLNITNDWFNINRGNIDKDWAQSTGQPPRGDPVVMLVYDLV